MFCNFGYFNNPFLFNSCMMMPNSAFNFFMPNFRVPVFSPFIPFIPMPNYAFGNNFSIFNSNNYGINPFRTQFTIPTINIPAVKYNRGTSVDYTPKTEPDGQGTMAQQTTPRVAGGKSSEVDLDKNRPVKKSDIKKELGPEFLAKTKQVAKNLNCNYKDLLALMNSESSLDPKAVNKHTNATGLIQFMPKTAQYLGTSTEELKNMSALEQLDYVEKYLSMMKKSAGFKSTDKLTSADLYALTFLPAYAKQEVLTQKNDGRRYTLNAGLDLDKDGKITKTDLAARMASRRVNESIFA